MNERVSIGNASSVPRESLTGFVAGAWRQRPELRTHELHQRLLSLWAQAEIARLAGERLRQQIAAGEPGPEGSAAKLTFARLNQEISGFEIELLGADGLTYDDWSMRRPVVGEIRSSDYTRNAAYRYLRAKGNSIEGGTSEVLRNIIAERVLRLPQEPRTDTNVPWKDLPR
jgi:alkylation response protein AidB-like acyl-CoA dehydrogenase